MCSITRCNKGLQRFVQDLNRIYRSEHALFEVDFDPSGFQWIDCNDSENSVISFIRRARNADDFVVAILNFTPVPRDGYRIGVPAAGPYLELVNSDGELYGGIERREMAASIFSEPIASHGDNQSLRLTLPPLGFLLLKPSR